MTQTSKHFEAQIVHSVRLDYLLYLPPEYESDPARRWPLILFLHGAGSRGSDVEFVRRSGIPQLLDQGLALPFIVVSPQCPADSHWTLHIEALNALLDDVVARHRVDERRISATGMSMGGAGVWFLAGVYPDRFAALAPLASRIVPLPLARLKALHIWVFHGETDEVVPLSEAERTVEGLKSVGGDVRLTVCPGVGHDLWPHVYSNAELYTWLLGQQRA